MNLLLPDSGLLFWMTIIFAIVFFVLAKFGFPVITGMVEKRRTRIEDAIEAARKAEEAIAHLSQEQERIMAETRAEQAQLMKEAAAERERMIEKKVSGVFSGSYAVNPITGKKIMLSERQRRRKILASFF